MAVGFDKPLARDVGARSLVLLKNDKDTLPLRADVKRLCLLGPLADAGPQMGGPWGAAEDANAATIAQSKTRRILFMKFRALPKGKVVHIPDS